MIPRSFGICQAGVSLVVNVHSCARPDTTSMSPKNPVFAPNLHAIFRRWLAGLLGGSALCLLLIGLAVPLTEALAVTPEPVLAPTTTSGTPVGLLNVPDGGGSDGTLRRVAVPILMYHYISVPPTDADVYRRDLSVTPGRFREQLQYLAANGYHGVSLYDVNLALRWGMPLPEKPVVLTFDDGYRDAYTEAFPLLQEFGFTGTFFVVTSRLDEGHPDYLTWAQAQEMAAAGMSIESHTKDHPSLAGRDTAFLFYQIQGSLESIEAHTGQRPRMFCYPSGRWDESVLEILDELGVWSAVVTEGGIEHTLDAVRLLRRVRISGDTDLATFAALLGWEWDRATS